MIIFLSFGTTEAKRAVIRIADEVPECIYAGGQVSEEVKKGQVKFFNFLKGFGFICYGGEDYFVHVTDIENGDLLLEDEEVEFVAVQGSKGWQAIAVNRLSAPDMTSELGTVKFYDQTKGYGFVERAGKADVFAHFTDLLAEYRSRGMVEGDRVEFSVRSGRDGRDRAYKIKILE